MIDVGPTHNCQCQPARPSVIQGLSGGSPIERCRSRGRFHGHGTRRSDERGVGSSVHLLPRSPARRRGPQESTARSEKRTTPRQHRPDEGLGRSRGGLTCKIHLAGEGGCCPLALLITPGLRGRQSLFFPTQPPLPATTPHQAHHPRTEGPVSQPPTPRQQKRPTHRIRQGALQAPQRTRADYQPAQELPGPGWEVRQTGLRLPRHHHPGGLAAWRPGGYGSGHDPPYRGGGLADGSWFG